MKAFAIVLLVTFSFESFSQETDTYQPDSVYRINHVKTRLVQDEAANPWQTLWSYDSLGRLEIWTLMKDEVPLQKIVYQYDDKGKQVEEAYWHGTKFAEKATIVYDESSRVVGKYLKYEPGNKPKMDILISYKPFSEIKRYWKADGNIESEFETYYEKQYISKRSKGRQGSDTWDYEYSNTFGKTGRLVRRESIAKKKVVQTMLYQYDTNGLLVRKTTMSDLYPPIIENFTYTYR